MSDQDVAVSVGPAWERLEEQIQWYDSHSARYKRWFHSLKVAQIVIAAAIPALAAAGASAAIAGALGATIVVLEGLQQLFQFQQNWVSYRATAEALKHERFALPGDAGPYAGNDRPDALLAERVESLVSQETAAWPSRARVGKGSEAPSPAPRAASSGLPRGGERPRSTSRSSSHGRMASSQSLRPHCSAAAPSFRSIATVASCTCSIAA